MQRKAAVLQVVWNTRGEAILQTQIHLHSLRQALPDGKYIVKESSL